MFILKEEKRFEHLQQTTGISLASHSTATTETQQSLLPAFCLEF